jgi:competence protein ComEA
MSATGTTLGVPVASATVSSAPAAPSAPAPSISVTPVWPRSAQLAAASLLALTLGLLGWQVWDRQRSRACPTQLEPGAFTFRVDLNRADRAQLLQLPGVGPAMATRIEAYRREHYGFRDVEELKKVSGIGPATFERLRSLVYVDTPEIDDDRPEPVTSRSASMRKDSSATRTTTAKKEGAPGVPLDINTATADDLQRLPGIGPTLAGRIIARRKDTPFKSVDDLRHVSGIGAKTLEKLRPFVTVASATKGSKS